MTLLRILNFAKLDSRWSRYSNKLFLSSRDMTHCAGGNKNEYVQLTYWLSLGKVHTKSQCSSQPKLCQIKNVVKEYHAFQTTYNFL